MAGAPGVQNGEFAIDAELVAYVQLIWSLDVAAPAAFGAAERIVPDGIVEAIFHHGTAFDHRYRGASFERLPASFVISMTRRFVEIRPAGRGGFVSVRFHPWGAGHFFALPMSELADRTISARELWGSAVDRLEDRLAMTSSIHERARLIQPFLIAQLRRHRKESVEALVRRLGAYRGHMRVVDVCRDLGMTQRTLERTCVRTLGCSPKHLLRLRRFLRACRLLRESERPHLANVALRAGYYDQAHCIADFQAFAGMTPRAFVSAEKAVFLDIG